MFIYSNVVFELYSQILGWAKSKGYSEYWLGLNDKANEGTWTWESGESLTKNIKWDGWRRPSGCGENCEPNNARNQNNVEEDCATTCWGGNEVCDIRCGDTRPYMCQRPISGPEYVATIEKRKVYYSHVRRTYDEARQECDKISATLVGDEEGVDTLVSFAPLNCQKHSVVSNINSILDKQLRNVLEYAKQANILDWTNIQG